MPRSARRMSKRCGLLSLGVLVALLCCTGQAYADSATFNVLTTDGKSDPVAGVPRVFSVSGTSAVSSKVYVKYRATGGAACAPSAYTDSGSQSITGSYSGDFYGSSVNGAFNLQTAGTFEGGTGTFLFCIWIASSDSAITTPITQTITFRAPTGTISATLNPASPAVDQDATVTITGSSESPKSVYASVKPAGGAGCAQTYSADAGTGLLNGRAVDGSFSVQTTTKQATAGSYVLCLWLASSSSDTAPIAGPQPVPFTVQGPPPPPPPPVAIQRIAGSVSLRRRASRYSGRLTTASQCGSRRTVVLRRLGSGKRSFGRTLTRTNGTFTFNRNRRLHGSLYVVVAARTQGSTVCSAARSGSIRG